MKTCTFLIALLFSTAALAHCPDPVTCEMKGIDSALTSATLQKDALDKIKSLRDQGAKLHDEGRDQEALKVLKEARKLLKEAASS